MRCLLQTQEGRKKGEKEGGHTHICRRDRKTHEQHCPIKRASHTPEYTGGTDRQTDRETERDTGRDRERTDGEGAAAGIVRLDQVHDGALLVGGHPAGDHGLADLLCMRVCWRDGVYLLRTCRSIRVLDGWLVWW